MQIKLFCFPCAGGSSSMYFNFKGRLKNNISLYPIELAGRGSRIAEKFYSSFTALVEDVTKIILSTQDIRNIAIFGYSMGGLIAYEVAKKLYWQFGIKPKMIFFAASNPPHLKDEKDLSKLCNEELMEELIEYGGMMPEIVNNSGILDLLLPIIRSDIKLINEYDHTKMKLPLPCDIRILYSDQENIDNITEWSKYTSKGCEYFRFPDGHFFINHHIKEIIEIINSSF